MIELDEKSKEALTNGLRQAKSKRMFFALVVKGNDGILIVAKLKIPPKQIADAKKTCGGNTIVRGACFGEKEKLIFEVAKPPAPTWDKIVKTIAHRDANLTISPEFRLGTSDDLKDEDEDEDEGEEQVQATSETPHEPEVSVSKPEAPASPVVPPAPQHDPALAQVIAALGKLMPALQAAIKASPQQKDELIKLAGEAQSRIKSGDAAAAKESLLSLGKLVTGSTPNTTQGGQEPPQVTPSGEPEPPQAPKHDPALAQVIAAMGKLGPAVQAAIKANPERKDELMRLLGELQTLIKSGDAAAAKESLLKLGKIVKESTRQVPSESSNVPESGLEESESESSQEPDALALQAFNSRRKRIEASLLAAQKANPERRNALAFLWDQAGEFADAGKVEDAVKTLDKLEQAIQEALETAPKTDTERFGIEAGITAERVKTLENYFREQVEKARQETTRDVLGMAGPIGELVEDEQPEELVEAFVDEIDDLYDDVRNSLTKALASGLRDQVVKAIADASQTVKANKAVQLLERAKEALSVDPNVLGRFEDLFANAREQILA